MDSEEMNRLIWSRLELLPQLANVVINRSSGRIVVISPDLIQELSSRQHSFRGLYEKPEELKFLGGERNRHFGSADLHRQEIDAHVTELSDHASSG
jgi:hypothetical protein